MDSLLVENSTISLPDSSLVGELSGSNVFICINHFRNEDIIQIYRASNLMIFSQKYHVLDLPTALMLFQLFFKVVYFISLQQIRRQSVLVENLRKENILLKIFVTALFKTSKIVYNSLWIVSRFLKPNYLICIFPQIGWRDILRRISFLNSRWTNILRSVFWSY